MAIPPDLDIDRALMRLDVLSGVVANALGQLEELQHRVRTLETARRAGEALGDPVTKRGAAE